MRLWWLGGCCDDRLWLLWLLMATGQVGVRSVGLIGLDGAGDLLWGVGSSGK